MLGSGGERAAAGPGFLEIKYFGNMGEVGGSRVSSRHGRQVH